MDITRLIARQNAPNATGIDRVELAYARHFQNNPDTIFVKLNPYFGPCAVDYGNATKLIDQVSRKWSYDSSKPETDTLTDPAHQKKKREWNLGRFELLKLIARQAPYSFGKPVFGNQNSSGFYIHTSHSMLEHRLFFQRLNDKAIKSLFMVHDIIPITHPEFCGLGARPKHEKRMATVAEFGDAILVNSKSTGTKLKNHYEASSIDAPPIMPIPLGIETSFSNGPEAADAAPPENYFVYVSTIEGRKNHTFLFNVWREIIELNGEKAPKLVVVGKRGWQCESATAILDRSAELRNHITELSDLDDQKLKTLLTRSRGALMPSTTEGFSLPYVEAQMLGIPVLASDIDVHREFKRNENCRLISPIDGEKWISELMALAASKPANKLAQNSSLEAEFRWKTHFEKLEQYLANI